MYVCYTVALILPCLLLGHLFLTVIDILLLYSFQGQSIMLFYLHVTDLQFVFCC